MQALLHFLANFFLFVTVLLERKDFIVIQKVLLPVIFLGFNPLTTYVLHYTETNQLICYANQLAGFYLMGNIGR